MTVFLLFLAATAATLVGALLRLRSAGSAWPVAMRGGLAALFLVTGTSHFVGLREDLIAMVPPALPAPELLVTITGVLELAGAAGLLLTPTAAWAAGGLALLLVGMFPANVYAASSGATLGGEPATALVPRAAMQVAYLAAAISVLIAYRRRAVRPSDVVQLRATPPAVAGPASDEPVRVVLVSRLELRSLRDVPAFLSASLRLRRAFRRAPGAVSLRLAAQPLARTFWTWSAWADESAMQRYTRSRPHVEVMRAYRSRLQDSAFRTVTPPHAPETWSDVRRIIGTRQPAAVGPGR